MVTRGRLFLEMQLQGVTPVYSQLPCTAKNCSSSSSLVSCALLLCLTRAGRDAVGPGCSCCYCHTCPAQQPFSVPCDPKASCFPCRTQSWREVLILSHVILAWPHRTQILACLSHCCLFRRHAGDRTAAFGGEEPGSPANHALFLSGQ